MKMEVRDGGAGVNLSVSDEKGVEWAGKALRIMHRNAVSPEAVLRFLLILFTFVKVRSCRR